MTAYYNEFDKYAAKWLRNLIAAGHIAPGIVDDRSIEDVTANDLKGFTQCHFFAGVGAWSLALRRAGWPDDRPVWTASCPCQPFSTAGQSGGFTDERHLWPHFQYLAWQRRPPTIFGEQVASKDAEPWIDLVQTDLEALDYSVGAVAFPSAGVGAPHIRDRLYWMAHAAGTGSQRRQPSGQRVDAKRPSLERGGALGGLADTNSLRWEELFGEGSSGLDCGDDRERALAGLGLGSQTGRLEHAGQHDDAGEVNAASAGKSQAHGSADQPCGPGLPPSARPGPTNGLWRDADWLFCRDGKWRPVEPSAFPLAHGAPARVGRLRAYGNAINAEAARVFIEAGMEAIDEA